MASFFNRLFKRNPKKSREDRKNKGVENTDGSTEPKNEGNGPSSSGNHESGPRSEGALNPETSKENDCAVEPKLDPLRFDEGIKDKRCSKENDFSVERRVPFGFEGVTNEWTSEEIDNAVETSYSEESYDADRECSRDVSSRDSLSLTDVMLPTNDPETIFHTNSTDPCAKESELPESDLSTVQLEQLKLNVKYSIQNKVDGQYFQKGIQSKNPEDPAVSLKGSEHQNHNMAEATRVAEEHSLQFHGQEKASPKVEPLVSDVLLKKETVDKVSLLLDQRSSVLQNWENLACELGAPQNIQANCRRTTQHSPTELLFESLSSWSHTENLHVNEVIEKLNEMQRKDAVEVIKNHIPENKRENKVSIEITNNEELLEELANRLDKNSKVLKSWHHLGLKLGVKLEILQEIKNGNSPNAVEALFEYIYAAMPVLTVEVFKKKMDVINRQDVKELLAHVNTGDMKEVAPLHSDMMRSICYLLNKSSSALKNWRHFACELGIDYNTYKSFEAEAPESPTNVLLEWASINKPSLTMQEFCTILKKMKRFDVIEVLMNEFGQSF